MKKIFSFVFILLIIFISVTLIGCGRKDSPGLGNQKIIFEESGFIHTINGDGTDEKRIGEGSPRRGIYSSPDGNKIVFGGNEVYLKNVDGTGKNTIFTMDSAKRLHIKGWLSPESIMIRVDHEPGPGHDFIAVEINSGDKRTIVESTGWLAPTGQFATFCSDKELIAYVQMKDFETWRQEGCGTIILADFTGREIDRIDNIIVDSFHNFLPDCSGFLIRLSKHSVVGRGSLHIFNLDSFEVGPALVFGAYGAQLSPDGKILAYNSSNDLYTLELDDPDALPVKIADDFRGDFFWSPDSKYLAFSNRERNLYIIKGDGSNRKMIKEGITLFNWLPI